MPADQDARSKRGLWIFLALVCLTGCVSPHVALGTHRQSEPEQVLHLRIMSKQSNPMVAALSVELANRGYVVQKIDKQEEPQTSGTSLCHSPSKLSVCGFDLVIEGTVSHDDLPESVSVLIYQADHRALLGGINWQNGYANVSGFLMERLFRWGVVTSAHQIAEHIEVKLNKLLREPALPKR